MHRFEPYIDFRRLGSRQGTDISLWPSFTDIMTVILMIFMLTMTMVIIKNADLARQLLFREAEQQKAARALEESRQQQDQLKITITNLEEKLRAKEMEIILLGDEIKVMESSLEAKLALISALEARQKGLQEKVQQLESETAAARAEKDRMARELEEKIASITEETRLQIEEFNRKFAALTQQLGEQQELVVVLNTEKRDLELALAKQRKAFVVLEDKYNKLIGPARSPLGKMVAAVQYAKKDGQYRILFKDVDSDRFEEIDRPQLDERLGKLQSQFKDKLYVKVIIPGDSGLSYNEAWNFTRDILSKYDYYYQE
jgi:biopolymer transport protein ExbD